MKLPVFGISGSTCSGKTSIVKLLKIIFPETVTFNQDHYYFEVDDKRHVWCDSLKHINWELVTAFDNDRLADDIDREAQKELAIIDETTLQCLKKDFNDYTKSGKPALTGSEPDVDRDFLQLFNEVREQVSLVAVEGITILNHPRMRKLFQKKFFLTLDYKTCSERRALRLYDPPDVLGYFEAVVWPEYEKIKADVLNEDVQELDGRKSLNDNFVHIVSAVLDSLNSD